MYGKKFYILPIFLFSLFTAYSGNSIFLAPHVGDTIIKTRLPFYDAGSAGKGVIWDFRNVPMGKEYVVSTSFINDSDSTRFIVSEHRTKYYWCIAKDSIYCLGFENSLVHMPYTTYELRGKSGMCFGDTISGIFSADGEYGHKLPMHIEGETKTVIDATGVLLLPEDTIVDCKRIHIIRSFSEIFGDTSRIDMHMWQWFCNGCVYPVFESMRTMRNDSTEFSMSLMFSPTEQEKQGIRREYANGEVFYSDSVFAEATFQPNPVRTELHIKYKLMRNAKIGFMLHNALGVSVYTSNTEVQDAGIYSRKIPMSGLITGAYTLYIYVDDVVIRKVILKE